jgi:hypothetical protein
MYIDIRVTFKEVHKSQTWPDGDTFEEWTELEPASIRRHGTHYLSDNEMYAMVTDIWENDDWQEKFVNGTLAALHGQETLF